LGIKQGTAAVGCEIQKKANQRSVPKRLASFILERRNMGTRNTPILQEIIEVLSTEIDDEPYAIDQLESHFQHRLLVDAGDVALVAALSEQLRLNISTEECSTVLDEIASRKMVRVDVDCVEEVINDLFDNRFTEP
jgi:precorrin isomerase